MQSVAANMTEEEDVVGVFAKHREAYGRLDVLVNNAGVGIGAPMEEIQTKHLDMQLGGQPAGADHRHPRGAADAARGRRRARQGADRQHRLDRRQRRQAWLSIYAATKAAVINFTQSTHREAGAPASSARRWRPASSTRR